MMGAPGFSQDMTDAAARMADLPADGYQAGYIPAHLNFGQQTGHLFAQLQPSDRSFDFDPRYTISNPGAQHATPDASSFSCPACQKSFPRQCELKKHFKTHDRPFKCPEKSCKFFKQGWPTAKELERHINDKHSSAPNTFACRFQPCSYNSKRESNCKQHMEKAHGWNYIRTRSTRSYKCPVTGCSDCLSEDDTRQRHGDLQQMTPLLTDSYDAMVDTVPGADGTGPAALATPRRTSIGHVPDGARRQSYGPWPSPLSPTDNAPRFLDPADANIDPRLAQQQLPLEFGPLLEGASSEASHFPVQQPALRVPLKMSCSPHISGDQWAMIEENTPEDTGSRRGHGSRDEGASRGDMFPTPTSNFRQSLSLGPGFIKEQPDQQSESEEEHPRKRQRLTADDDLDDDKLPCPFRLSDPEIFNRDREEKYSPCHTPHKDISTIVRHLSRPAHRLEVNDRWISSFDVVETDRSYPRAGLCRKCWKSFRNRDDFQHHIAGVCLKASRGKGEKYRLLYNTFCTDPDPNQEPITPSVASNSLRRFFANRVTPVPNDGGLREAVDIKVAPSHQSNLSLRHNSLASDQETVSLKVHLALVAKVEALERKYRRLKANFRNHLSECNSVLQHNFVAGIPRTQTGLSTSSGSDQSIDASAPAAQEEAAGNDRTPIMGPGINFTQPYPRSSAKQSTQPVAAGMPPQQQQQQQQQQEQQLGGVGEEEFLQHAEEFSIEVLWPGTTQY